ncbi:dihydrofolate reductase [Afifella pfennigii]|uniref:dihydrofolate reductase n=1 Tax=Afifella pfennigii TaxID=209897 RepID=UPI00047BF12D|nr:dihydrofolate reductase [Afifella pfennigii]
MSEVPLAIVVGVARNGVIGREGGLPWRSRADLARFRATTMGKPLIMGRRTFQSLPGALDGRANIVLSRDATFAAPGVEVAHSFAGAIRLGEAAAKRLGADEICVIGGASLFTEALPQAERIYFTEIEAEPQGDVFFPDFDRGPWREVAREALTARKGDTASAVFTILERG